MNTVNSLTAMSATQKEVDDFIGGLNVNVEICEQDPRAFSIESFDLNDARFVKNNLYQPDGEEIFQSLKEHHPKYIRLGIHQFLPLWRDCEQNGEQSMISALNRKRHICSMNFFGTVLENPHFGRGVISLFRRDYWSWHFFWFNHHWNGCFPSILLFQSSNR